MRDPFAPARDWRAFGAAIATAKAPWAAVAIIALALILTACGVDREYLDARRGDVRALCEGAITAPMRAYCQQLGIDTARRGELY